MARTEEHYIYDSDCYCYSCLPVPTDDPAVHDGSGEQDTPAHCSICDVPLSYELTKEGVEYVIEHLVGDLAAGPEEWERRIDRPDTYYNGCRHIEISRDWAEYIKDYSLSYKDEFIVETFLRLTAPTQPEPDRSPLRRRRRAIDLTAIREGR